MFLCPSLQPDCTLARPFLPSFSAADLNRYSLFSFIICNLGTETLSLQQLHLGYLCYIINVAYVVQSLDLIV